MRGVLRRLAALGWRLDQSFGSYVQTFPASLSLDQLAERILTVLKEGYDADLTHLGVATQWVVHEACPPRHGPSQNLAGMVDDDPVMASTAVHACAYSVPAKLTADAIVALYEQRVAREIQRLRINSSHRVFLILQADKGYIQCEPDNESRSIFCEAASDDSVPDLSQQLTKDRIAHLHELGFEDPGRTPNYWKLYPVDRTSDAAIAEEILSLLHDVYGYDGEKTLEISTEQAS